MGSRSRTALSTLTPDLIITPAAKADIASAINWYAAIRLGLASDFQLTLDAVMDRIVRHPQAHPVIVRSTRRALLRRFSYAVFYRPENNAIQVFGVLHTSLDPQVWQTRSQ